MAANHRSWRQVRQPDGSFELVEIAPRPRISEDLRFDCNFISPIDRTEIRSKRELEDHNKRHGVIQILPGMDQDMANIRKANRDPGKKERLNDVIRAVEQGERNA